MPKRWTVKRTYRYALHEEIEINEVDEIRDAHDLVEGGPDFRCLFSMEIKPNPAFAPDRVPLP